MAIHALILKMTADGVSATQELPDGKWCHSPEYFKYRYGKGASKASAGDPKVVKEDTTSTFNRILRRLEQKLTPAERVLLIAQLEEQ